ncbi:hypothetical protein FRC17_002290, partial [Serendipita sp. 399]
MRLFRFIMKPRLKVQVSDPNNAPETEIPASLHSPYQLVMPPELWIKILTLQAIIEPYLYKEVIVNTSYSFWSIPDTQAAISVLYRAIKTPRLANHIVVFKIWLNGYTVPCRYCLGTVSDSDPRKPTDDELGEILVNLPRLRLLSYGCRLHGCATHLNQPRHRLHSWLANLRTDTLHHLEIGCGDYQWNLEDYRLLSAPCMQNLKAFKVDALCSDSNEDDFASMLQANGDISQNITSLCYLNSAAHNWVLSHRSIKNVVCVQEELATHLYTDQRPALAEALMKSKTARLEKLYVLDVETWLPNQNPLPYLNLVSIGSIRLSHAVS